MIAESYKNSFVCDKFYETFNKKPFGILNKAAERLREFSQEGEGAEHVCKNIGARLAGIPFLVAALAAGVLLSAVLVVGTVIRPIITLGVTVITMNSEMLFTAGQQLKELGIFLLAVAAFVVVLAASGLFNIRADKCLIPVFAQGGVITATLFVAPIAIPLLALVILAFPETGYGFLKDITKNL